MSRKKNFVKINSFTPLLSDTLPYEVPMRFSNQGFYQSLKRLYDEYYREECTRRAKGNGDGKISTIEDFFWNNYLVLNGSSIFNILFDNKPSYTYPLSYKIKKNDKNFRKLSLIHPLAQIKICDLYKEYRELILYLCSKSSYSLRHPSRLTRLMVSKNYNSINKILKDEKEQTVITDIHEEQVEDGNRISFDNVESLICSYFVYKDYKFLHSFYDSDEFIALEKKYKFYMHIDIRRCFESIYTHSIAWAIKEKKYSKYYLSTKHEPTFASVIDKLMQYSNYKETNGIPIGSELSRIFSEIILQKVDVKVKNHLDKQNLGKEYKIRRYIDDIFIFSNNDEIANLIFTQYANALEEYKLYINDEKTKVFARPFTTDITITKDVTSRIIQDYLDSFHNYENKSKIIFKNNNDKNSSKFIIKSLRNIVFDKKVTFYDISNMLLSKIKKELLSTLSDLTKITDIEATENQIQRYIDSILNVSFYIFFMSKKTNSSFAICKIIFLLLRISEKTSKILKKNIKQKTAAYIYNEITTFLEQLENHSESFIEYLDLIWILQVLGPKYLLPSNRLEKIFKIDKKDINDIDMSYFEIVILLEYIKKNNTYADIKDKLINIIYCKFTKDKDLKSCETFLLLFDLIKCPYLDDKTKKKILTNYTKNNKQKIINIISEREWFFDWNENINIDELLQIKEIRFTY